MRRAKVSGKQKVYIVVSFSPVSELTSEETRIEGVYANKMAAYVAARRLERTDRLFNATLHVIMKKVNGTELVKYLSKDGPQVASLIY